MGIRQMLVKILRKKWGYARCSLKFAKEMGIRQMLVKICGITSIEAGLVAERAGANFIGFVFAPSSRRVTLEQAANISQQLSPSVMKVGVFVNESKEKIERIAEIVGLD